MSEDAQVVIDVFPSPGELEVTCQAKANKSKLKIAQVTFHALTDAQYQQIVDAIELYRMRKNLRERERAKAGGTMAQEATDET